MYSLIISQCILCVVVWKFCSWNTFTTWFFSTFPALDFRAQRKVATLLSSEEAKVVKEAVQNSKNTVLNVTSEEVSVLLFESPFNYGSYFVDK